MKNRNHTVKTIAHNTYLIEEFGLDTMYLLVGEERALLIDTGTGVADLKGLVEQLTDKPLDVVATHSHMDHIGGCTQFDTMYIHPLDMADVKVDIRDKKHYAEQILQRYPKGDAGFSLEDIIDGPMPKMLPVQEGSVFELGNRRVTVMEMPGHTKGSIVLLDPTTKLIFSGDAANPIFLLLMPADTRLEAVTAFLPGAKHCLALRKHEYDAMYGGHDLHAPIDPQVLPDLIACAEGILGGTIVAKRKQIHIFDEEFYSYGMVNIMLHSLRFT